MKFYYSRKYLRRNLVFCIPFIFIIGVQVVNGTFGSDSLLFILAALVPLSAYFLWRKYPYARIEGDVLSKNPLAPKRINLNEVIDIEKYTGNYIFRTEKDKLVLDTTIIRPNDLLTLNEELQKRALPFKSA